MALHLLDVSKQVKRKKNKKRAEVIHQGIIPQPVNQGRVTETQCNFSKILLRHTFLCWKKYFIEDCVNRNMILELVELLRCDDGACGGESGRDAVCLERGCTLLVVWKNRCEYVSIEGVSQGSALFIFYIYDICTVEKESKLLKRWFDFNKLSLI